MTNRPIPFSAPMVRALIREAEQPGTGKTQTRRIIDPEPDGTPMGTGSTIIASGDGFVKRIVSHFQPKWQAGDRLWVREAWKPHSTYEGVPPRDIPPSKVFYGADDAYAPSGTRWRSSIHMPRWASRLTLHVTGVKVERLQDIGEANAVAEGVFRIEIGSGYRDRFAARETAWADVIERQAPAYEDARLAFADLRNSLHGPDAWAANPFVCAITFRPVLANIDALPATEAA